VDECAGTLWGLSGKDIIDKICQVYKLYNMRPVLSICSVKLFKVVGVGAHGRTRDYNSDGHDTYEAY
jgi:hypothetical protein